jgi:hypothetical protein
MESDSNSSPKEVTELRLPQALAVPKFKNAACLGLPTNWWFPELYATRVVVINTRRAIATCYSCSEKRKCQDFALDNPSIHGIWGGMTVRRRNRVRTEINHICEELSIHGASYSEKRAAIEKESRGSLSI